MNKVRLIRSSFFIWILILAVMVLAVNTFGLPHIIWSYDWRGDGRSYGDIAGRHYTRCTYVGPFGVVTAYPADGACDLLRLVRPAEASQ